MDRFLYNRTLLFILIIFSSTFFSQFLYTFLNHIDSPIKILFMSFIKPFVIGNIFLIFLIYERSLEFIRISKWFILSGIILLLNEFFHEIENIENINTTIKISKQIFYTKYVSSYLTSTFIFAIFEFFYRKKKFDLEFFNLFLNILIFVALALIFNRLFGEAIFPFYIFQQFINNNSITYEMVFGIIILFYFNKKFNKSFLINFKLIILSLVPIFLSGRGASLCIIIVLLVILIYFKSKVTYLTKFIILALVSMNTISFFQQLSIGSFTNISKYIEVSKCVFKLDTKYLDAFNINEKKLKYNYKGTLDFSKKYKDNTLKKCILLYENYLNVQKNRSLISDDFFSIQSRFMVDYLALKIASQKIINGIGNKAYQIKFDNVGIHSLWALMLVSNGIIFLIIIFYSLFKYFSQFRGMYGHEIMVPVFILLIFKIVFINQFSYIYSLSLIIIMIYSFKRYKIGSQ